MEGEPIRDWAPILVALNMGGRALKQLVASTPAIATGSRWGAVFAKVVGLGLHASKVEHGLQHFGATVRGKVGLGGGCECPQCSIWWALAGLEGWDMPDVVGLFILRFDCIDLVEDLSASLGMDKMAFHSDQSLHVLE
jgi:hypothetical protein